MGRAAADQAIFTGLLNPRNSNGLTIAAGAVVDRVDPVDEIASVLQAVVGEDRCRPIAVTRRCVHIVSILHRIEAREQKGEKERRQKRRVSLIWRGLNQNHSKV